MKQGDFGVVRILRGEYAGQLGFYDDDEFRDRNEYHEEVPLAEVKRYAVVYLAPGNPAWSYVPTRYQDLVAATGEEYQAFFHVDGAAVMAFLEGDG